MARKSYDMVNEVLAHFDFERVHETMNALNWTWAGVGVPTMRDLKEEAERLMSNAIEQAIAPSNLEHHNIGWISATGGFKAMAWKNEDGTLAKVQLEFIVTEWDAYDDSPES